MATYTRSCCCPDIKRTITGFGVFATVTSLMQILVTVAVFTGFLQLGTESIRNFTLSNPGAPDSYMYILYITLSSADFLVVLFSLILLCGNECSDERTAKCHSYPWLIFIPFYIVYESGINIYYFIDAFNPNGHTFTPAVNYGFTIVPLVYWVVKDTILFIGFVLIAMYVCPCNQYVQRTTVYRHPVQPQTFVRPASVTVTGPSFYSAGGQVRAPSPPACNGACYRQGGRSCQSCQYMGRNFGGNSQPAYGGYSQQNTGAGQYSSSSVFQAGGLRQY